MNIDDYGSSVVLRITHDGGSIVLKCPRCKKVMIKCKSIEEMGKKFKKLLGSSAKFIACPDYERNGKSFKCPKCHEIICLTEVVTPFRELAPIDRPFLDSTKSPERGELSETTVDDIRFMFLPGIINTIVGIVGLVYGSPWAITLVAGVPMLIVALLGYKDYKRAGWIPRIATVIAYVLAALCAVVILFVALALLPFFAMLVVYLLLVNLVFIVPLTGEFWSPGKYGGYTSLPQTLVWGIRICLALIGLILLFVWLFLG